MIHTEQFSYEKCRAMLQKVFSGAFNTSYWWATFPLKHLFTSSFRLMPTLLIVLSALPLLSKSNVATTHWKIYWKPRKRDFYYCTDIATHLNSTVFYSPLLTNCDACGLLYITGGAKCWVATLASEKTGSAFVGAPVAVTSEDPWWGALATISIRLGNRPGCCCCCCCCCCCTR